MQEIYIEDLKKVLINKKKLESELEVKISNKGKLIFVEGDADDEFIALEVLEAINQHLHHLVSQHRVPRKHMRQY